MCHASQCAIYFGCINRFVRCRGSGPNHYVALPMKNLWQTGMQHRGCVISTKLNSLLCSSSVQGHLRHTSHLNFRHFGYLGQLGLGPGFRGVSLLRFRLICYDLGIFLTKHHNSTAFSCAMICDMRMIIMQYC